MGYRHNVWTSALAEGGLPLFMGYLVTCLLLVVVGKRLVRARMDQGTVMMGAIASLHGFMSIVFAAATMTFNQQRPAIPLGLICGLLLRTRDMQLAVARSYEGYLDAEEGEFILPPIEEYA
jgi:O-antigen ligase